MTRNWLFIYFFIKRKTMKKIVLLVSGVALTVSVNAHQLKGGDEHDSAWNWNQPSHTHDDMPAPVVAEPVKTIAGLDAIAKPGECYVTAYVEGTCSKVSKKVMVKEEYVEKSCTDCAPLVPKVVKEKIMISPERVIEEFVPALYENVGREVLVTPAKTVWKKGNFSAVTKNIGGETYCLVEEPAVYETIVEKVLVSPATSKKKVVPAVYKEYEKTIYVQAEQVVKRVPAEYKTIETCVEDQPGHYEWRSVLCEQNATKDVLTTIEKKLAAGNYLTNVAADGVINDATTEALKSYQRANGLKVDGLVSIDTVKSMGVKY
jgi:hypothetical protein